MILFIIMHLEQTPLSTIVTDIRYILTYSLWCAAISTWRNY